MKDIRSQLPECPLEYEVPFIPGDHTALVIPVNAVDIEWQEKMLPWTFASLINNTDFIMKGVHLYIVCYDGTEARVRSALSLFDLPENTIFEAVYNFEGVSDSLGLDDLKDRYNIVWVYDINHWAFRNESNTHKFNFSDLQTIELYPPISEGFPPSPALYDMTHCTIEQFRHAIKHLMGAQLAMKI